MKKIKARTVLTAAVGLAAAAVCVRLLFFRDTIIYGFVLLGLIIVGFLVWKAFIKNGREDLRRAKRKEEALEDEVETLKSQIAGLNREIEEKNKSRLNVVGISPILHLAVMNIDSSFVRTYTRESPDGFSFNGALRADICAEYGVKLEEIGFKYDAASNTLMLSNFHPGLLSFSKKQLSWELARSYRSRHVLGHEISPVSDDAAEAFTKKMCEELRADLEREIDNRKIEEFEWLSPMISRQVTDMFKLVTGRPDLKIVASEVPSIESGKGYVDFSEFRRMLREPEIQEN